MNQKIINSRWYTLLYAATLVALVATLLTYVSQTLRPLQQAHIVQEQRESILRSVGLPVTASYTEFIADTNIGPQALPLHIATLAEGSRFYVLPLEGKGLWGPLNGYLAIDQLKETIYGIVLDHKSETPGLGDRITTEAFCAPFKGKPLYKDGVFVSVKVRKGGAGNDPYAVDALSGATLTSRGVEEMIRTTLTTYLPLLP